MWQPENSIKSHMVSYCSVIKTVFLKPIIENEVLTIVKKFKGKLSTSYDEVKMITVKSIIHNICCPSNTYF